jgi:multidrug efflux system membrane fusion protein
MHPEAASIPLTALQMGQRGPHVFVVRPDDTVEMRRVRHLDGIHDEVIVTEGLAPGERVVIEGQARLRDRSSIVERASAPTPMAQGSFAADARSVRR